MRRLSGYSTVLSGCILPPITASAFFMRWMAARSWLFASPAHHAHEEHDH
jgi:hypothetical protein